MKHYITLLLMLFLINLYLQSWQIIDEGLFFSEFEFSQKSEIGDSKVTIIKIDPDHFDFGLYCESEYGSEQRNVKDWVEDFNLICGVNGGMYETDYLTGSGYLKNYDHINNPEFRENWNMCFVCNPKSDSLPEAQLVDIEEENVEEVISQYNSVLQSIRMLSADGRNVWSKQANKWSEVALGEDEAGNILIISCSSAYGMKDFISELLKLPINLKKMMHLEGNVQSLYFKYGDVRFERNGSSKVSEDNKDFFSMPNAIGVKQK